jgi:hypothetical protein
LELDDSEGRPCRYGSLIALIHQTNEHTVAAITSFHGAAPTGPFAFPLVARDLTAEVSVEFYGELLGGHVADTEAL